MKNKNPYYKTLYESMNFVSWVLLAIGFGSFLWIFIIYQELYQALAIIMAFSWGTIFIRYFGWAIYFYNINYGWTDRDWEEYFKAVIRKREGEYVPDEELGAPKFNPYRSQSFGLPKGTVRGMIALTLLFGALSLLLSSFGKDGSIDPDSFYWDHFEFFKTAFLMMIAFYFGDKSLRYLQNRSNAAREKNYLAGRKRNGDTSQPSELDEDDMDFQAEETVEEEVLHRPEKPSFLGLPISLTSQKRAIAESESVPNPTGLVPVIDVGHGGIDPKTKKYTTAPNKMYEYTDDKGEVFEGVINRSIGSKLIKLLKESGIKYYEQTVTTIADIPLKDRVVFANKTFEKDRNTYFISIHSNASCIVASPGEGSTKARGFEVFTSRGQTKSDELADIAAKWYKRDFPEFKFRQDMIDGDVDKEADFYVLRKTACPALLVENLFFDNPDEAEFLMSEVGQMRIASCLFKIVKEIYETQNNGIFA